MRTLLRTTLLLLGVNTAIFAQPSVSKFPISTLGFVENQGQVHDQDRNPNPDVKFVYTDGSSFNLQLKSGGFSYTLFKIIPDQNGLSEAGFGNYDPEEEDYIPSSLVSQRVDVKLLNANPNPQVIGVDATETVFNFYTTGDVTRPILNVRSYSKVIYKNIYPNIDLVFTSPDQDKSSSLEYSWIVRKGGRPSDIRLAYDGTDGILANADGSLTIMSPIGTIGESKLISYWQDDKSPVASSYKINDNQIQYDILKKVDKTLVIDPNIIWAVDYGGENDEFVSEGDLAVDSKNSTVITGNTRSTLYIATVGAYQTVFAGGDFDAFLAKMVASGKLSWATYFGGPDKDEGHAVTTDPTNNIYLGGITHSTTGIATPGSYRSIFLGKTDAFMAKFTASGLITWSTYVGGNQEDQINAMTSDSKGNIYFSGFTTSDSGFATPGAYQDSLNSQDTYGGDACVGEFRSNGIQEWCSYLGGPATDRAHAIGLGKKKELYIQGTVESTSDFAAGAVFQTTYGGGLDDAFVAKWDTNGKFYWCSYYGGEGDDHGRGVVVDQNSDLYIIGWTDSDSAMGTPNAINPKWYAAFDNTDQRLSDGYLAKFHSDGTRVWGTYYGGEGRDQMKGLAVDKANGYVYAIGLASSANNISTPGAFQETFGGSSDGMLLKTDLNGNRIWGTYAGDSGSDKFQDMEIDPSGFVYCLMEEDGIFPLTPGTNLTTYKGATDAVVVKFSPFDACTDQYEPNETLATARKILAYKDSTLYGYTGAISSGTDQDYFKFTITPNYKIKIVLTDLTKDYNLNFYNSSNQLIFSSSHPGTVDEQIIYNNVVGTTFKVQVAHSNTVFDANNCYRLKIMIKSTPWALREDGTESDPQMGPTDILAHAEYASDHFNLNISSAFDANAQISLLNSLGQPQYVSQTALTIGSQSLEVPAENLPDGIYFIRIRTELNNNVVVKVAVFH